MILKTCSRCTAPNHSPISSEAKPAKFYFGFLHKKSGVGGEISMRLGAENMNAVFQLGEILMRLAAKNMNDVFQLGEI